MSLDKNLFTLIFTPHKDSPLVTDLVDPAGNPHYRKQRVPGSEYKIEVYDFVSESLLATVTAPAPSSKVKTIELHNPNSTLELKFTGTLTFRWSFKWEEHEFEWKREECFIIRKPDPPVIIAVTRESAGRPKTTSVQILDYNLNRFDINDRKGLEIVVLTALLTFQDAHDAQRLPAPSQPEVPSPVNPTPPSSRILGNPVPQSPVIEQPAPPPPPPPKPPQKTGVDRIAELQAMKGEYNEIIITEEGSVQDYATYCSQLLQDDAMLFITVKSAEMMQVPRVLQVVEETKRIRHKAGLSEDEELYQYVLYDTEVKKGPRRINLDDSAKNKYAPPQNLVVHLSKISMPELQPKAQGTDKKEKKKDDKKASTSTPTRPAPPTPAAPSAPPPASSSSQTKPPTTSQQNAKPLNKLHRPGRTNSPSTPSTKINTHQAHPYQPTPSPSQLNNPSIYTAPPPVPGRPRPQNNVAFPQPWSASSSRVPTTGASLYASAYAPPPQTFPPQTWTPPGPPPLAPVQQPTQPTNPPINAPASKPLSASNVVHGLFDFINSHRK